MIKTATALTTKVRLCFAPNPASATMRWQHLRSLRSRFPRRSSCTVPLSGAWAGARPGAAPRKWFWAAISRPLAAHDHVLGERVELAEPRSCPRGDLKFEAEREIWCTDELLGHEPLFARGAGDLVASHGRRTVHGDLEQRGEALVDRRNHATAFPHRADDALDVRIAGQIEQRAVATAQDYRDARISVLDLFGSPGSRIQGAPFGAAQS